MFSVLKNELTFGVDISQYKPEVWGVITSILFLISTYAVFALVTLIVIFTLKQEGKVFRFLKAFLYSIMSIVIPITLLFLIGAVSTYI